jgi:hypothetical protein
LYFVSEDTYVATFPDEEEGYVIGQGEYICSGDTCTGTTPGLYVPASVDDAVLQEALIDAVGFDETTPEPTPFIDWPACERGERPHPDLDCSGYEEWEHQQQQVAP